MKRKRRTLNGVVVDERNLLDAFVEHAARKSEEKEFVLQQCAECCRRGILRRSLSPRTAHPLARSFSLSLSYYRSIAARRASPFVHSRQLSCRACARRHVFMYALSSHLARRKGWPEVTLALARPLRSQPPFILCHCVKIRSLTRRIRQTQTDERCFRRSTVERKSESSADRQQQRRRRRRSLRSARRKSHEDESAVRRRRVSHADDASACCSSHRFASHALTMSQRHANS